MIHARFSSLLNPWWLPDPGATFVDYTVTPANVLLVSGSRQAGTAGATTTIIGVATAANRLTLILHNSGAAVP